MPSLAGSVNILHRSSAPSNGRLLKRNTSAQHAELDGKVVTDHAAQAIETPGPDRVARSLTSLHGRAVEGAPVGGWGHADLAAQVLAERLAGAEAAAAGHLVDGEIGGLQQLASPQQPLLEQPLERGHTSLGCETAGQGAPTDPGVSRPVAPGGGGGG